MPTVRVSTEQEEQSSSIELQEQHYVRLISENPNWENAGIFSEQATGLNLQERPEFCRMIKFCKKKKIDLILIKSISRFGRYTLDMLRTLRALNHCGTEVYFEQENMRLSSQTLAYFDFPVEHWSRIRTNNVIEWLTGRSATEPAWWAPSRTATLP